MWISFGVLLSIVLKRNRKSRLTIFRQTLQKQQKSSAKLIQYPSKMLFCICFILAFAAFIEWFASQLKRGPQEKYELILCKPLKFVRNYLKQNYQQQYRGSYKYRIGSQSETRLRKLDKTHSIKNSLDFYSRILNYSCHHPFIQSELEDHKNSQAEYNKLGLSSQISHYHIKVGDKLQIWEMGENRFTHTDYYYSIRLVNKESSFEVIKKSNIYSSRTSVIELAFIHSIPFSTKIKKRSTYEQHQTQQ